MLTPDPASFGDSLAYFREFHRLVLQKCDELDRILVEGTGDSSSLKDSKASRDLLDFFSRKTVQHERDEEELLFPVLSARLPHMGFQQPGSPIGFIVEGHELITRQTASLLDAWKSLGSHDLSGSSLTKSATHHSGQQHNLQTVGKELTALYRKHIAMEEEKVYHVADETLTADDRQEILEGLRARYDNEAITTTGQFEPPQFSDPAYNVHYVPTEAKSGQILEEGEKNSDDE